VARRLQPILREARARCRSRKGFSANGRLSGVRFDVANGLRVLVCLWAAALLAFLLAGCGADGSSSAGTVVPVSEADFQINAPTNLRAGEYTLRVSNHGPTEHELIVVRSSSGRLPMRGDGLTVSEEALDSQEAGSLEPGRPGAVRDLRVHLTPGRYVLFCNMEGHYMAGMHSELVVSA